MKTIELTEDECYLIEREFDYLYSKAEAGFKQWMEQFMLLKATEEKNEILLKKAMEISLDFANAIDAYKNISGKFEKIRLEK